MKAIRNNILIAVTIAAALLHLADVCRAQAFLSDQLPTDPRQAAMGGVTISELGLSSVKLGNPAARVRGAVLSGHQSVMDLRNHGENDSRVEATFIGLNLGDAFAVGVQRTNVFFEGGDGQAKAATPSGSLFERTEAVGAAIDLARLMLPGAHYLSVALGADYKSMRGHDPHGETGAAPQGERTLQDLDYGSLAELRVPLARRGERRDPSSYLALTGSYVLENARRNVMQTAEDAVPEEAGYAETTGLGAALVLGAHGRTRHGMRIQVGYEKRRFEQARPDETTGRLGLQESLQKRYGMELSVGDVVFGRVGRVEIDGVDRTFDSFGFGLALTASDGAVQLRLDYARAPWLNNSLLDLSDENGDPAMIDQISAQVAFGL